MAAISRSHLANLFFEPYSGMRMRLGFGKNSRKFYVAIDSNPILYNTASSSYLRILYKMVT